MWSVGVVVYCLLGGYLPFCGDVTDIKKKVVNGRYKFHSEYWDNVSTPAKEMIAGMMQTNPDNRLTAEQALRCEWMGLDDDQLTVNDLSRTQHKLKQSDKLKTLTKRVRINLRKLPFQMLANFQSFIAGHGRRHGGCRS
jgi:serine/threonine protein kinase